jgi:hypothetical protein
MTLFSWQSSLEDHFCGVQAPSLDSSNANEAHETSAQLLETDNNEMWDRLHSKAELLKGVRYTMKRGSSVKLTRCIPFAACFWHLQRASATQPNVVGGRKCSYFPSGGHSFQYVARSYRLIQQLVLEAYWEIPCSSLIP